jgi:hypothetical protein
MGEDVYLYTGRKFGNYFSRFLLICWYLCSRKTRITVGVLPSLSSRFTIWKRKFVIKMWCISYSGGNLLSTQLKIDVTISVTVSLVLMLRNFGKWKYIKSKQNAEFSRLWNSLCANWSCLTQNTAMWCTLPLSVLRLVKKIFPLFLCYLAHVYLCWKITGFWLQFITDYKVLYCHLYNELRCVEC